MSDIRTGILLAAGASTRMKSKTSKLLHSVLGRTLIEWAVEMASSVCDELVIVVGHQRESLEAKIKESFPALKIDFAHQKEQKGTADAVRVALEKLPPNQVGSVFIMGADSPLLTTFTLERAYR